MRLEDALFYVILDHVPVIGLVPFCEAAIVGGVDVIHMAACLKDVSSPVREICSRDDALLVISDDPAAARDRGADGAHISDATLPVGQVRAMLGPDCLVGVSSRSRSDAMLALEMEVDYLLHWEGTSCAAEFAALPGATGNVLFAAGLNTLEEVRTVVDSGIYRVCIDASLLENGDVTGNAIALSKLLGRSM